MMDVVLSAVMLAALALIAGAAFLWRRNGGPSKQVWLMLLLAAVMVVNVLVWTVPDSSGNSPMNAAAQS